MLNENNIDMDTMEELEKEFLEEFEEMFKTRTEDLIMHDKDLRNNPENEEPEEIDLTQYSTEEARIIIKRS